MEVRDATDADEPALLDLVNQGQPEPMSLDAYRRMRASRSPDDLLARRIGIEGGDVVAYLNVERQPVEPPTWTAVSIKVKPHCQRQGLGQQLWQEASREISQVRVETITASVRDDDPTSRAWAERRGFSLWAHRFQSVLDLTTFDPSRFPDAIDKVEAAGIRLSTFAEVAERPDAADRLYDLVGQVGLLTPDNDQGTVFNRRDFDAFFGDPAIHPPAGTVIALDGEDLVGVTTLMTREPGFLYTSMSGVLTSHQGRGIALALKLRSTEIARSLGATRMGTNNLSINAPILAINRKMGYEPQPGIWLMRKPL